jgi:hypothetical protein
MHDGQNHSRLIGLPIFQVCTCAHHSAARFGTAVWREVQAVQAATKGKRVAEQRGDFFTCSVLLVPCSCRNSVTAGCGAALQLALQHAAGCKYIFP